MQWTLGSVGLVLVLAPRLMQSQVLCHCIHQVLAVYWEGIKEAGPDNLVEILRNGVHAIMRFTSRQGQACPFLACLHAQRWYHSKRCFTRSAMLSRAVLPACMLPSSPRLLLHAAGYAWPRHTRTPCLHARAAHVVPRRLTKWRSAASGGLYMAGGTLKHFKLISWFCKHHVQFYPLPHTSMKKGST